MLIAFLIYHRRRKPSHTLVGSPNNLSPLSKLALQRQAGAFRAFASSLEEPRLPGPQDLPFKRVKIAGHDRQSSPTPRSESGYESQISLPIPVLRLPDDLHQSLGIIPKAPGDATSWVRTFNSRSSHIPSSPSFADSVRLSRISATSGPRFYQLQNTAAPDVSFQTFTTASDSDRIARIPFPAMPDTPPYPGSSSSQRRFSASSQARLEGSSLSTLSSTQRRAI